MIRDIIKHPHPLLRAKAVVVQPEEIPHLGALLTDMFDTLKAKGGVGLAACQISSDKNIFVVDVDGRKHVFINPVIISADETTESEAEGCLSLPGIVLKVSRSTRIKAMYRDETGEQQVNDFAGGWARIFQHEFDHLQGIMIDDRIGPVARMMARKKSQKMERKRQLAEMRR